MADRDQIPPAGELIYLPRPSWAPPAMAAGALLVLIGIFAEGFLVRGWVYMIIGALVLLAAVRGLIATGVREFYERPRSQRPSTAVLPAGRLRAPKSD